MSGILDTLLIALNATGLQKKDQQLYDFLKRLIAGTQQINSSVLSLESSSSSSSSSSGITGDEEFLTASDETATLPNSRELLAGTGITFDDSVSNERTISANVSVDHVLMGDGATPPSPMTIGNQFMYVAYTP